MAERLRLRTRVALALLLLVVAALVAALLWSFQRLKPVWHDAEIHLLGVSPDGEWLLSGDVRGGLKLWAVRDLERGWGRGFATLHASLALEESAKDETRRVTAAEFTPDSHRALVGFGDGRLQLWDLETRTLERTLQQRGPRITAVAIGPDARTALTADEVVEGPALYQESHGTVKSWDLATGRELRTLGEAVVHHLGFSRDGKRVLATVEIPHLSGLEYAVNLYDATTWQILQHLPGVSGRLSPDGLHAVTGSTARTWLTKTDTGERVTTLSVPPGQSFRLAADGSLYAFVPEKRLLRGLAGTDLHEVSRFEVPPDAIERTFTVIAPRGAFIAERLPSGAIRITRR